MTAIAKASQPVTIASTAIRKDAHGRYSLNDLHKAAIANGNATESHKPSEFLSNKGVEAFVSALDNRMGSKAGIPALGGTVQNPALVDMQNCTSVHSVKGGKNPGTYAVELVAIRYAAWISPDFEVDVYLTFQAAVKHGTDWTNSRHASVSTNKALNMILQDTRAVAGKATERHHYANEARLVNWVLCGEFKGLDRDGLGSDELDLLAHLEARNAVLIGRGVQYDQRKPMLKQYAMDWHMAHTPLLGAYNS